MPSPGVNLYFLPDELDQCLFSVFLSEHEPPHIQALNSIIIISVIIHLIIIILNIQSLNSIIIISVISLLNIIIVRIYTQALNSIITIIVIIHIVSVMFPT